MSRRRNKPSAVSPQPSAGGTSVGARMRPQFASHLKDLSFRAKREICSRAQERGKRIEIRSQWTDVFCELHPGRGTLVLLRADRDGSAADSRVDGCLAI